MPMTLSFTKVAPETTFCGILHGNAGVGKTSLAAHAPGSVMIDCEASMGKIACGQKIPVVSPTTWTDVLDSLALIGPRSLPWTSSGFKTVILDSLSKCQTLAQEWVLDRVFVGDVEKFGAFGRGAAAVYIEMKKLRDALDAHRKAGRNVICIAHTAQSESLNPDGADAKYLTLALQDGKNSSCIDLFVQWADFIGYIEMPYSVNATSHVRQIDPSRRNIHFSAGRNVLAKCRIPNISSVLQIESSGALPAESSCNAFWKSILKG